MDCSSQPYPECRFNTARFQNIATLPAAIGFVHMNTNTWLDIGFIQQAQQRLTVMAIGGSGGNRHNQPVIINHRMLLITKYRFAAFPDRDLVRLYLPIDLL
jgi:hypothetical protein